MPGFPPQAPASCRRAKRRGNRRAFRLIGDGDMGEVRVVTQLVLKGVDLRGRQGDGEVEARGTKRVDDMVASSFFNGDSASSYD